MVSSNDEAEILRETTVSTYYFEDHDDEPVSFSVLPLSWSDGEDNMDAEAGTIFLHGTVDNGLERIYKEVQSWEFDLRHSTPEVWVLSKDNVRFKLDKPRRSFQDTIRSLLIALHCLHYAKNHPEGSAKALWKHLARTLRFYEVQPSVKDLQDHVVLIEEAIRRDEALAESKVLSKLIEEKPGGRSRSGENVPKPSFLVDDAEDVGIKHVDDGTIEKDVCVICDDGGNILCCDGKCMRSFHATEEAVGKSLCESLGLSQFEVDAIQTFKCKNCVYNQHQCFACGKLGSSDKSSGADVFQCVSATCGQFYHPHCVAKLLHRRDKVAKEKLKLRIAAGESFTCPAHKCCVCNQIENKKEHDLQFAVCRRCPKSFHRKCLPKEIVFQDEDEDAIPRAWENLLPNRILIYCLKHDIDEEIGTPVRNHIKFPTIQANSAAVGEKRKSPAVESLSTGGRGSKKKPVASKDFTKRSSEKQSSRREKSPFTKEEGEKDKKMKVSSAQDIAKKDKAKDAAQLACEEDDSLPALDADTQRRILNLRKEAESSISMEDVISELKVPYAHAQYLKSNVDNSITIGKVEGAVQAVRAALQRLENGGNIEDAKAVCDPDVLTHIFKWKAKLRVYLAPFKHGMRYTSFGRHFTKVDKLQEIVDMLHWYVQDGDMIVDFCCGANDFSCLMAKKLEETGKKCSYKNFDIFPPKNNFKFKLRDWMTVQPNELSYGSKLVMGLNPPFGVGATLANKFIDKALEFKPKLLILITPSETERLDEKQFRYDLVWEDKRFLFGKPFYLPGSIDLKDKPLEQWNNKPPLLYLWSRRDWTAKHRTIAQDQGHLPRDRDGSVDLHYLKDDESLVVSASSPKSDTSMPPGRPEETKCTVNMDEGQKGCFSQDDHVRESREIQSTGTSAGKADGTGTRGREAYEKPPAKEAPHQSVVDVQSSRSREVPFEDNVGGMKYLHAGPSMPTLHAENYCGRRGSTLSGNAGMMYGLNDNTPDSAQIWSYGGGPPPTYGAQNLARQYTAHMGDANINRLAISEAEERYPRDRDMRSQIRLYGQQDSHAFQRNYMDPGYTQPGSATSTYGLVSSIAGSSQQQQMDMSVMQRYAPHLDEPHPIRSNNARPGVPMIHGDRYLDPNRVPTIHGDRYLDPNRVPQFGYQGDSFGFATGPRRPYSRHNTFGWLNE